MASVAAALPPPQTPARVALLAVQAAAEEQLETLCASALDEDIDVLLKVADAAQADAARRLRRREQLGAPSDGATSMVAWLSARCRMAPGRAADLVCLGRQLAELPETSRAVRDGEIGFQHASVMAHTASQVGAEAMREAEEDLVAEARRFDVRRFSHLARHFRDCVDAGGALADANRDHERARVHLSQTFGGCWRLDGWLDPEGGALLTTALNPLMKPVPGDRRSGGQRRNDALLELCRRLLDGGGLPLAGGQRPHLVVSVPVEPLRGEPGAPGGDLRWSGPVVGELVRRLFCDAVCTEVTVGPAGEPLAVGDPVRTIPPRLRYRLNARDGRCRFTDCTRPPEWCEAHHIRPRERRGPTLLENLVLLCHFHHTCCHEGGWTIRRVSETGIEFVPP